MSDTGWIKKVSQWVGLTLLTLLFAVWPVVHTISLRDLLLVLSAGIFAYLVARHRPSLLWRHIEWPVGLYTALTLWMIAVAVFVSTETVWSLNEIRGQWLKGTLALLTGGLAALAVREAPAVRRTAVTLIFVTLLLHVVYVDYLGLKMLLKNGQILRGLAGGLTQGPDASNYLSNMLLALLLTEAFIRLVYRERFLPLATPVLIIFFPLALFSIYAEGVRNGIIEILFVLFVFTVLFFVEHRQRISKTTVVIVVSLLILMPVIFTYLSYKTDVRWQTFMETVPLAWDTDANRQWINLSRKDELKLSSGEPVDWSNYMRMARIKAGVDLTLEYPLGVGFGRNAFGHAVMKKYGEGSSHSHSGLIDLAVGTGIPGTLLWLGFLGSLFALGWRRFRQTHAYCALALVLLVTGYGFRMLIDSTIRDHMLQMFLFLAAFLAVAATAGPLSRPPERTPAPAI